MNNHLFQQQISTGVEKNVSKTKCVEKTKTNLRLTNSIMGAQHEININENKHKYCFNSFTFFSLLNRIMQQQV